MKAFSLKALSLALLLSLTFACDDDDGDTEGALPIRPNQPIPLEPPGTTPTAPTDSNPALTEQACEDAWAKYVAARPIGLVLSYEHRTDIQHTGGILQDSSTTVVNEQTVIDSNVAHVVVKNSLNPTADIEITKVAFAKACRARDPIQGVGLNGTFKVDEQKSESIAVKAGTFAANYVKGTLTTEAFGRTITSNTETWIGTDERKTLIKMVSGGDTTLGDNTVTTTLTIELLSVQEP